MILAHVVPTLVVMHFVAAMLLHRRRTGYLFDFFLFFVGSTWLLPYFIIYQFAGNEGNVIATGDAFYDLVRELDRAFLITLTGYATFWIAKYWMDYAFGPELSSVDAARDWIGIRSLYTFASLPTVFLLSSLVCTLPALFVAYVAWNSDNIFGIRALVFEQPELRPMFNLFGTVTPFIVFFSALRFAGQRRMQDLLILAFFSAASLLTGSRGSLLYGLLHLSFVYVCAKREAVSYAQVGVMALSFLAMAMVFGFARADSLNEVLLDGGLVVVDLVFGNSFSDVRDFAWVLSSWDGRLLGGLTYLSALISFVPSFISDFRSTYGLGRVTASIAGLDPEIHPGLRPTMFGESYLNFGLPGVILFGFAFGVFMWALSRRAMYLAKERQWIKLGCYIMLAPLGTAFMLTPSFFSLYVLMTLFILVPVAIRALSLRAVGRA